ncbi:GNAT family N-acetyltransferase [Sorangium sp. So ce1335]|uniref:GNAT family N-acetyltransferase n=1 Tax=Sorangium sp. So ce1335 TaxID=3133335 RepID=UPI003F5DB7F3
MSMSSGWQDPLGRPRASIARVVIAALAALAITGSAWPTQARSMRPSYDNPIAALQSAVWGGDWAWLITELRQEQQADPGALSIHVAEAEDQLVGAGWARFHRNTQFASLWGGSTLRAWRGRGIYRSLVARRAAQARERGLRYLQVDASPDSRPILERLGMHMVSTTTPYVWSPPRS